MKKIIFETSDKQYRITEYEDNYSTLEEMMGDTYDPLVNVDISPELLEKQKQNFIKLIDDNGVFGYVLEKWNPAAGAGYETVDSCFGFIGRYDETDENFKHYIIEEMKGQIK